MKILLTKINDNAILPIRKFPTDAGVDVCSVQSFTIKPREQAVVRTGLKVASIPEQCCIQVWSKSGLDSKLGLHIGAGIIDSGYRGEILILAKNMSDNPIHIYPGTAIAQLLVVPIVYAGFEFVEDFEDETERSGSGGIVSTLCEGETK